MTIGDLPRLTLADMEPGLRAELAPIVERLGYLGEYFQVFGAIQGAVPAFMAYTKAVKAPLSDAENELLALAVCSALDDRYERVQHERLSLRLGFSPAWIGAACGRQAADMGQLSPAETALRELALALVQRHGNGCATAVETVRSLLGPEKTVAALLQITRFMTIATLCNALALSLPVPSIFEAPRSP